MNGTDFPLQMAYDRACEVTSDLSAAGRSGTYDRTLQCIRHAYQLSKDLQKTIKSILEDSPAIRTNRGPTVPEQTP